MRSIGIVAAVLLSACAGTTGYRESAYPAVSAVYRGGDPLFDRADFNRDGRLSLEEAEKTLPRIANQFGSADIDRDGYVSYREVRAFLRLNHWERVADRML